MDHLDHPTASTWEGRRRWFEAELERAQGIGSHILDEQACALVAEVQAVFCSGAWVAVVVIAAPLRQRIQLSARGGT